LTSFCFVRSVTVGGGGCFKAGFGVGTFSRACTGEGDVVTLFAIEAIVVSLTFDTCAVVITDTFVGVIETIIIGRAAGFLDTFFGGRAGIADRIFGVCTICVFGAGVFFGVDAKFVVAVGDTFFFSAGTLVIIGTIDFTDQSVGVATGVIEVSTSIFVANTFFLSLVTVISGAAALKVSGGAVLGLVVVVVVVVFGLDSTSKRTSEEDQKAQKAREQHKRTKIFHE
jgi:hypothetical protein